MAFDKGLYNIIHLIDIFNTNTDTKIVKYLGEKYLKQNLKKLEKFDETKSISSYKNSMSKLFETIPKKEIQSDDIYEKFNEAELLREIDDLKPTSGCMHSYKKNLAQNSKAENDDFRSVKFKLNAKASWSEIGSISTSSLISSDFIRKNPILKETPKTLKGKCQLNLTQKVLDRLETLEKSVRSSQDLTFKSFESVSKIGSDSSKEMLQSIDTTKDHNCSKSRRLVTKEPSVISNRIKNSEIVSFASNHSLILNKSKNQINRDKNSFNTKVNSSNDKIFLKQRDSIHSINDPLILKHISKINNYRYLTILSKDTQNKKLIENNLRKYDVPKFPLIIESSVSNNKSIKPPNKSQNHLTNCIKLPVILPQRYKIQLKNVHRINRDIQSLKKSGISKNNNCEPILYNKNSKFNLLNS